MAEAAADKSVSPAGTGDMASAYHVPLTYRAQSLIGADDALIGTTEHGVLGRRWVYDGTRCSAGEFSAHDGPDGTDLRSGRLLIRISRALAPVTDTRTVPGSVSATWRVAENTRARGILITAQEA